MYILEKEYSIMESKFNKRQRNSPNIRPPKKSRRNYPTPPRSPLTPQGSPIAMNQQSPASQSLPVQSQAENLMNELIGEEQTFRRSLSEANAIRHGLIQIIDTLTKNYIETLRKTLISVKFILSDIIFEYEYEIEVVQRAIDMSTIQSAAQNEDTEILQKTSRNMSTVKDEFKNIKQNIEQMIIQMEQDEPLKAMKLNSLLMFLGNTFNKGNIALKLFIHNLIPEDLLELFTKKYENQGLSTSIVEPFQIIDDLMKHRMKNQIEIDEVLLLQEDYEKAAEENTIDVSKFVLVGPKSEPQHNVEASDLREKILTRLAARIYERYTSPTNEDLANIDGSDIYHYAMKYFSFLGQDIVELRKDGKNLLQAIVEKLRMITLPENKIIEAIEEQITSIREQTEPKTAATTISKSRSPTQKIALIGYNLMKNIFTSAINNITESFERAYRQLGKSGLYNENEPQSVYNIPESLKVLNPNMLLIATDIDYRNTFCKKVYDIVVDPMESVNKEVKDAIIMYSGIHRSEAASQGFEPIGNFDPHTAKQELDELRKHRIEKRARSIRNSLLSPDIEYSPSNEISLGSLNGGKKMKKNKRKTVKKRKTKKNNKVEKKKKRRNRKSKKN